MRIPRKTRRSALRKPRETRTSGLLWACGLAVVLGAGLTLGGCESREARHQRLVDGGVAPDSAATAFHADITFCRRIARKSGQPIGVSEEFTMRRKSRVRALIEFEGIRPERTHALHIVWIAPDGREIFRKYAEVTALPDSNGVLATRIVWRAAEDVVRSEEVWRRGGDAGRFRLTSSLTTSIARQRDPGLYTLRVYLDRRLLVAKSFRLNAAT
jgi:hypothetical protein